LDHTGSSGTRDTRDGGLEKTCVAREGAVAGIGSNAGEGGIGGQDDAVEAGRGASRRPLANCTRGANA